MIAPFGIEPTLPLIGRTHMTLPALEGRGFLPGDDPLDRFPAGSPYEPLDELGRDLPSLLMDDRFRERIAAIDLPALGDAAVPIRELRLYYVRVGFLASAFINQVGLAPARVLPRRLAIPLCEVCSRLDRPPILSYDGYALYNWKRFRRDEPVTLGNIDTIQNFVHLYDEHWFILVHVEIEAIAGEMLVHISKLAAGLDQKNQEIINQEIIEITASVARMTAVLRRIPEKMDPALYYRTFRPYIRFFEGVIYEGVAESPLDYRGETGAQSAVIPTLVSLLKIPHRPSALTDHLAEMRRFMPAEHRRYIERVEALEDPRGRSDKGAYNELLEALAGFREIHLGFAREYIARWVVDPRGTGGTPYLEWLGRLIDETRAHKIA